MNPKPIKLTMNSKHHLPVRNSINYLLSQGYSLKSILDRYRDVHITGLVLIILHADGIEAFTPKELGFGPIPKGGYFIRYDDYNRSFRILNEKYWHLTKEEILNLWSL
jgi:hypothetical protein